MSMTPEEAAAAAQAAAAAAALSAGAADASADAAAADRAVVDAKRDAVAADLEQVDIWRESVGEDKAAVTIMRDAVADDKTAVIGHKNAAAASRQGAAEDRAAVQAAKEQVDIYATQVAEDRALVEQIVQDFAPEVVNPLYQREIRFLETPVTLELLDQIEFVESVTFPANFSQNRGHCRGVAPSAAIVFTVKLLLDNGTDAGTVGAIGIATNRAITRTTSGGVALAVPQGGTLQIFGPVDAKGVTNVSEVLVGTRVTE